MQNSTKSALTRLIAPVPIADFYAHYSNGSPLFLTDLDQNIPELFKLPYLQSLKSLCACWPGMVDAYLPGLADEVNSTTLPLAQAQEIFSQGHGLLFNDANDFYPELNQWLRAIQADLGLSSLTYARSLIYAIPKDKGTSPHFDQNINFVLQISGTKKWWIAPNAHVSNPMSRHTIGADPDPELASYSDLPLPDKMPDNAQEFTLTAGSLLVVPRGCWHQTQANEDALSLNFTYSAPTWIDLLTSALRARLAQSPDWRATADFITHPEYYQKATKQFDHLLAQLVSDMPHWQAQDILEATEMGQFPPKRP